MKPGHTLLEVLFGGMNELQGSELEAALFESADDVADESTLDTVGLHKDEWSVLASMQRDGRCCLP